jgi:hypothetical protein
MYPPIKFECLNQSLRIMASEPISTVYLTSPSYQSVCLYVYFPVLLLHNCSINTFPRQRRSIGGVVFICGPFRVKGESAGLCMYIPLSFLGNGSVNTLPRQRSVGDDVFYAIHVLSKKSSQLVLPGTSVIIVKLVSRPVVSSVDCFLHIGFYKTESYFSFVVCNLEYIILLIH